MYSFTLSRLFGSYEALEKRNQVKAVVEFASAVGCTVVLVKEGYSNDTEKKQVFYEKLNELMSGQRIRDCIASAIIQVLFTFLFIQ